MLNYIFYNNILLFDIPKALKTWVFKEEELEADETVENLLFEQFYDTIQQQMTVAARFPTYQNNFALAARKPLDLLFIETISQNLNYRRIWVADKWGFNKRVLTTIAIESQWYLDIYNMMIQVFSYNKEGELQISTIEYI